MVESQPTIPVPPRPHRRRATRYSIGAVAGLTMLVSQCAPQQCGPTPPAASPSLSSALQQVVDLTNQARASEGKAPLTVNAQLNSAAKRMSDDMASHDTIQPGAAAHQGSDGTNPGARITAAGYKWSRWAENIAAGYPDAQAVVQAWLNSPGHRENIMNGNLTQIGVAVSYSGSGQAYWTQDFGTPG
jgi:uncharacterized protein YkwD